MNYTYTDLCTLIDEFVAADTDDLLRKMGPNETLTVGDDERRLMAERAVLRGLVRDLTCVITTKRYPEMAMDVLIKRMQKTVYEAAELEVA